MPTPLDPIGGQFGHGPDCVIVVPTLNEVATIALAVSDLLADETDWPILVIDGGSTDGTRELVREMATRAPQIRLIDNPAVSQAAAINLGAKLALGLNARVLIRADAHARYPHGFTRGLLRTVDTVTCDSVVTPLIATQPAATACPWAKASVALQNTWLGTGGALHRHNGPSGPVDHGHHAAFRLRAFLAVGGYDEAFVANEDAEFDLRLSKAGGQIYLQSQWPVAYFPRTTPSAVFRQYWRNGRWRMQTARKHGRGPGARQMLPMGAVATLIASVVAGLLVHPWLFVGAGAYLLGILLLAARRGACLGQTFRIAALAATMHVGFGLGALTGLVAPPTRPAPAKAEFA